MTRLIDDRKSIVEFCRTARQKEVIAAILVNKELKAFISNLTDRRSKDLEKFILHDTILAFIRTCLKPEFELLQAPLAYLKVMARNTWYMECRKRKLPMTEIENLEVLSNENYIYQKNYDLSDVMSGLLERITEDCKQILEMWAMKYRMIEIADRMSMSSEQYAKKRKHLCLKKLISLVDNNKKLKEELKLYV